MAFRENYWLYRTCGEYGGPFHYRMMDLSGRKRPLKCLLSLGVSYQNGRPLSFLIFLVSICVVFSLCWFHWGILGHSEFVHNKLLSVWGHFRAISSFKWKWYCFVLFYVYACFAPNSAMNDIIGIKENALFFQLSLDLTIICPISTFKSFGKYLHCTWQCFGGFLYWQLLNSCAVTLTFKYPSSANFPRIDPWQGIMWLGSLPYNGWIWVNLYIKCHLHGLGLIL